MNNINIKSYIVNAFKTGKIIKFGLVGISGIAVNMGLLWFLTEQLHFAYWMSSIIAIEMSILTNFILNNLWTWTDQPQKQYFIRIFEYHLAVGISALLGNWLILIILTQFLGVYYLVSNLIGIAIGSLLNFILNDLWTFKINKT